MSADAAPADEGDNINLNFDLQIWGDTENYNIEYRISDVSAAESEDEKVSGTYIAVSERQ